jgi:hypothetical protein
MRHCQPRSGRASAISLRGTLALLTFGLAILAFLVSIGHPEWFRVRPVSGAAVAMVYASDNAANATDRQ